MGKQNQHATHSKQERNVSKVPNRALIVYTVVLFAIWTLYTIFIMPKIEANLSYWPIIICKSLIKITVWALPALYLIQRYQTELFVPERKFFRFKMDGVWLAVLAVMFAYLLLRACLAAGAVTGSRLALPKVASNFGWHTVIYTVLVAGITEELVFRAWIFNALYQKMDGLYALVLQAVLFVLIHYPLWLFTGMTVFVLLASSATVFVLGLLFAWSFQKSKSIFVPICLHMVWNLFVSLWG